MENELGEGLVPRVSDALAGLSELIWPEALVILGISVLTMALLQVVKDVLPLRPWVQRLWFLSWLRHRVPIDDTGKLKALGLSETDKLKKPLLYDDLDLLLRVAFLILRLLRPIFAPYVILHSRMASESSPVGTISRATDFFRRVSASETNTLNVVAPLSRFYFYKLPPELLAGQLMAGLRVAVDYPSKYPALVEVFAPRADPTDLRVLAAGPQKSGNDDEGGDGDIDYEQARDRVANLIQRNIDTIPIMMEARWRFMLRLLAMLIAAAFVLGYAYSDRATLLARQEQFIAWGAVVVVSGYLAPVLHELLARLQGRRERRS